jgi:hypothetical protein
MPYLRLEYWDTGDIIGFAYSTGLKNVIYLKAELETTEFPYEEEGVEDGDREFVATFQKITRNTITSNIVVTPAQLEALSTIQIHNLVSLRINDVVADSVKYFKVIDVNQLETKEFYQVRLQFQTLYSINRPKKDVYPVFNKTGSIAGGVRKDMVSEIKSNEGDLSGPLYHGKRVIFTGLANKDIREYDSSTGQWVQSGEIKENILVENADDGKKYFYNGLDWNKNSEITSVELVSGDTYKIKGHSRVGYIAIDGTTDGVNWTVLVETTSGEFSYGVDVELESDITDIRARYYVHGGEEELIGDTVVNPASTEFLSIIQNLDDFETEIGSYSDSQNFTIEGTGDESTDVVITAPTNFEVSLDNITFSDEVTVVYSGGIALTTIYMRMSGNTSGYKSGNIELVVDGKTYRIAVSGEVVCSIIWISDYLDVINGEEIESTIEDKLDYLLETKSEISQAIENNGGDGSGTFRNFATEIENIGCIWETFEF